MPVLPIHHGRTLVMGVLNITPDSFSDGGRFFSIDDALVQARRLVAEGADILDVGAESTRPGSDAVSEQEELDRAAPVVEKIAREFAVPVSIDTYKPVVADECCKVGATIVNDVTGLTDSAMIHAVRRHGAAAVIMHMRGKPKTMQQAVDYADVIVQVREFLAERVAVARKAGIDEIVIDPGIGFGKSATQNFELLQRLRDFEEVGVPILVGPSRKSFLSSLPSRLPVDQRLEGTIAACCAGAMNGASIVRVHDVQAVKRAIEVIDAIRAAGGI
jgi:dihydropteroate synthase